MEGGLLLGVLAAELGMASPGQVIAAASVVRGSGSCLYDAVSATPAPFGSPPMTRARPLSASR